MTEKESSAAAQSKLKPQEYHWQSSSAKPQEHHRLERSRQAPQELLLTPLLSLLLSFTRSLSHTRVVLPLSLPLTRSPSHSFSHRHWFSLIGTLILPVLSLNGEAGVCGRAERTPLHAPVARQAGGCGPAFRKFGPFLCVHLSSSFRDLSSLGTGAIGRYIGTWRHRALPGSPGAGDASIYEYPA